MENNNGHKYNFDPQTGEKIIQQNEFVNSNDEWGQEKPEPVASSALSKTSIILTIVFGIITLGTIGLFFFMVGPYIKENGTSSLGQAMGMLFGIIIDVFATIVCVILHFALIILCAIAIGRGKKRNERIGGAITCLILNCLFFVSLVGTFMFFIAKK